MTKKETLQKIALFGGAAPVFNSFKNTFKSLVKKPINLAKPRARFLPRVKQVAGNLKDSTNRISNAAYGASMVHFPKTTSFLTEQGPRIADALL